MRGIILIQHPSSQVRDVLTRITFASDINLVALHAEHLNESSPEIVELIRDINLILHCSRSRRKARASGLVHVDHVCKVRP